MQQIAFGQLGLNPLTFWDMTQREFWNSLEGHIELEEQRERRELVRTRWHACLIMNCFASKETTLKPKDLILFDWEVEEEAERQKQIPLPTKEDFKRIAKSYGLKV